MASFFCKHYSSGDNKPPNNDVRDKFACIHYTSMKCPVIDAICKLEEYALDKPVACKIKKGGKDENNKV